jgi:hypothetical protein
MIVRTRFVVEFSRKLIKVSFLVYHELIQFSKTFHRIDRGSFSLIYLFDLYY